MVIRKAKRIEHDKLILNSHNKIKTTWDIINKEPGKNKKRSEIQAVNFTKFCLYPKKERKKERKKQALKVEVKKSTDQQTIAKTFNVYFVAITENVKRQSKNSRINDVTLIWIVTPISWNKLLLNLTQVWNVKCTTTKEVE